MNLKQVKQQQMLLRLFPEFSSARQTRSTVQVCYLLVTKTQQHIQESKSSKTNCFSQRIPSSWIPRHKSKNFQLFEKYPNIKSFWKFWIISLATTGVPTSPKKLLKYLVFFWNHCRQNLLNWNAVCCSFLLWLMRKKKIRKFGFTTRCLQETIPVN